MYRGGRGFRNNQNRQKKPRETELSHADAENPILQAFHGYSKELDDKHDRYERIVKLGRDITIESKRIIFLLHTIDEKKNRDKIMNEAKQRLQKVIDTNFRMIAQELDGLYSYQFKWAYSPGLQEFIEAYTFMEFMQGDDGRLSDWNSLQNKMCYLEQTGEEAKEVEKINNENENNDVDPMYTVEIKKILFNVDPTEYILGLSDLAGELMRRCINSLGSGETEQCINTCKALQRLYSGYISLNVYRSRELSRKISTMHQSVIKSENVCYNVKVRGGEAAKWGSVNAYDKPDDVDEGYF